MESNNDIAKKNEVVRLSDVVNHPSKPDAKRTLWLFGPGWQTCLGHNHVNASIADAADP